MGEKVQRDAGQTGSNVKNKHLTIFALVGCSLWFDYFPDFIVVENNSIADLATGPSGVTPPE